MDAKSWGELQRKHRARVYGLCYKILQGVGEAEDACGETFLRAERSRDRYDPARPFAQWILTIASRVSIDRIRRRGLESKLFEPIEAGPGGWEPVAASSGPLESLLHRERAESVRSAITELAARDRIVLVLKFYAELNYDEIGEVLGLSRAHIGSLVFRAKRRLRRQLVAEKAG